MRLEGNKILTENKTYQIYQKLYTHYGPQGWWPLSTIQSQNTNKTGSTEGYHPLDYTPPHTENEKYEIGLGAILTQNTTWTSVTQALKQLKKITPINPEQIQKLNPDIIKQAIKPAGYYNQKTNYILNFTEFFLKLKGKTPTRKQILQVKGIGNETADSILLYAYKQEEFIVDTYTRRIFTHLQEINEKDTYLDIKKYFENNLKTLKKEEKIKTFQEYHALIVEHAKNHYTKKPYGKTENLLK